MEVRVTGGVAREIEVRTRLESFHGDHDQKSHGNRGGAGAGFRGGTWYRNASGEMVFQTGGSGPRGSRPATQEDMASMSDPSNLKNGSPQQRSAHKALEKLPILEDLAKYNPVLAGTVPLDVATDTSDLDILCEVRDLDEFEAGLHGRYGGFEGFATRRSTIDGLETVLANFTSNDGWPVEVFGQARPAVEQHAFVHMAIEHRLLKLGGAKSVQEVKVLKQSGMKTEPAFAQVFGISGDPYSQLVKLSSKSDRDLKKALAIPWR